MRAGNGADLVLVIDDLREPLARTAACETCARLREVHHEPVAIVIVAGVLLIEMRERREFVRRADILAVPVRDPIQAVGIDDRDLQQDDVVADRARSRRLRR